MKLVLEQLICGYHSPLHLPFSLLLEKPMLISVIGRNGAGKSTLLKTIGGWHQPWSGKVLLNEKNIHSFTPRQRSKIINYISAREHVFVPMKVKEYLALGRIPYLNVWGILTTKDKQIIADNIRWFALDNLVDRYLHELSDGQYQRVKIARALIQQVKVLLLDEPFNFLDIPGKKELFLLLRQNTDTNACLTLISTHEADLALQYSDLILFIHQQHIISLPPASIREDKTFAEFLK